MGRPKRPRDTNQLAKLIVDAATGEREGSAEAAPVNELARAGGLKGGKVRASRLTPEQRSAIARQAAAARWGKMTAEIAVLNKFGISIAADSAVTVETFHDGEIKQKVYNSANKIFALSKHAPIGLMFYNTVTLGGVPWETIVKSYRKKLDDKVFPILNDYYEDF